MKVYISYSAVDRAFAIQLREWLHGQNIDVWMDIFDIPEDANPHETAQLGREECNIMMAIFSPHSMRLRRTTAEWDLGLKQAQDMFALQVEPCNNIPSRFATIQHLKFNDPANYPWDSLEKELRGQNLIHIPDAPTIFISYRSLQAELAYRIRDALHKAGLNTWLDRYNLPANKSRWDQKIDTALHNADAVIALLTKEADTPALRAEWRVAIERKIPLCFLEYEPIADMDELALYKSVRRIIGHSSAFDSAIAAFIALVKDTALLKDFHRFTYPESKEAHT